MLNRMYRNALERGGAYTELVSLSSMFGRFRDGFDSGDAGENMISVRLLEEGDSTLMMLFNTELVPLKSTVMSP